MPVAADKQVVRLRAAPADDPRRRARRISAVRLNPRNERPSAPAASSCRSAGAAIKAAATKRQKAEVGEEREDTATRAAASAAVIAPTCSRKRVGTMLSARQRAKRHRTATATHAGNARCDQHDGADGDDHDGRDDGSGSSGNNNNSRNGDGDSNADNVDRHRRQHDGDRHDRHDRDQRHSLRRHCRVRVDTGGGHATDKGADGSADRSPVRSTRRSDTMPPSQQQQQQQPYPWVLGRSRRPHLGARHNGPDAEPGAMQQLQAARQLLAAGSSVPRRKAIVAQWVVHALLQSATAHRAVADNVSTPSASVTRAPTTATVSTVATAAASPPVAATVAAGTQITASAVTESKAAVPVTAVVDTSNVGRPRTAAVAAAVRAAVPSPTMMLSSCAPVAAAVGAPTMPTSEGAARDMESREPHLMPEYWELLLELLAMMASDADDTAGAKAALSPALLRALAAAVERRADSHDTRRLGTVICSCLSRLFEPPLSGAFAPSLEHTITFAANVLHALYRNGLNAVSDADGGRALGERVLSLVQHSCGRQHPNRHRVFSLIVARLLPALMPLLAGGWNDVPVNRATAMAAEILSIGLFHPDHLAEFPGAQNVTTERHLHEDRSARPSYPHQLFSAIRTMALGLNDSGRSAGAVGAAVPIERSVALRAMPALFSACLRTVTSDGVDQLAHRASFAARVLFTELVDIVRCTGLSADALDAVRCMLHAARTAGIFGDAPDAADSLDALASDVLPIVANTAAWCAAGTFATVQAACALLADLVHVRTGTIEPHLAMLWPALWMSAKMAASWPRDRSYAHGAIALSNSVFIAYARQRRFDALLEVLLSTAAATETSSSSSSSSSPPSVSIGLTSVDWTDLDGYVGGARSSP